ncbi:MAG: hypothetical protein A3K19_00515 [Lentisphaerae bacterium RIFOXYB12_FULL_65_16]|nr:MAG: hypothetical protein A3K18_09910 [Lentisphaerae bacterium RIFOXYA12_64_32]OGV89918.1 MAG: hypothetical protein A3K19_00515 [Lentisphaerae bacterium RIFOXYB12_FULL_65_16]
MENIVVHEGSRQFSGRTTIGIAVTATVGLLCVGPAFAAQRAPWHHAKSPYRAEMKVTVAGSHPDAGTAVSVPVCGLGRVDGTDFIAYDDQGQQLPLTPLGASVNNEALALVAATTGRKTFYVYFGSQVKGPVAKGFLPSLTLDVRTLPEGATENWPQIEALLGKSQRLGRIFVDNIEQSYDPVDSTDAVLLVFEGYLNVAKAGPQTLMLISDDAGYLFVDDKLLVSRDGRHWARDGVRGESKGTVDLTAGPHPVKVVVADFGGDLMALVARWIDGKNKNVLRANDFVQPARTQLVGVDAQRPDAMPLFWTRQVSYMSHRGAQYTEVELGTYNKAPASWELSDGARFKGPTLRKIMAGLDALGVAVEQGGVRGTGVIMLPEMPPPMWHMDTEKDFQHYSALMLSQNLNDLPVGTLRGYLNFLDYKELNDDKIPFCEAILKNSKLEPGQRTDALLMLARASAAKFPDKAKRAYEELLRTAPEKTDWGMLGQECAEYAIFGCRDFVLAGRLIDRVAQKLKKDSRQVEAFRLDLALQQGQEPEARKLRDELVGGRDLAQKQRYAAVKGNALRERFYDLLRTGFVFDARETLWNWMELAPSDRLDGSLPLARARLLKTLGWLDGALGELDGAILLDPLLPNLPEVELERGQILKQAGNAQKAKEVFARVAKEFPNHPAAAEAKEAMK